MQFLKCAHVACVATLFALNACGGGGDELGGICSALGGGNSSINSMVTAGTIENTPAAFDGSLSSIARYTDSTGNGSARFDAQAQSGVIAAAGQAAGVLLTNPPSNTSLQISISTKLNGVVQETGTAGFQTGESQICPVCIEQAGSTFFGIQTNQAYNGIEVTLKVNGLPVALEVRELCTR
jgi:hypothetical protein